MKKLVSLLVFLTLAQVSPARAVDFANADLEGKWSLHAFGAYEVQGTFYYGQITLDADGRVVNSGDCALGWSPAVFDGGGLAVLNPQGEVGGRLSGLSFHWGGFWIAVKKGRLNLTKDQITFIGQDYRNYQLIVTMVRMN
jgi:hypothetical protein